MRLLMRRLLRELATVVGPLPLVEESRDPADNLMPD